MLMIKILLTITLLIQGAFAASNSQEFNPEITVSGISSGGYFAQQFHVVNSSFVNGAAIFAAGPFYCAKGSAAIAMKTCMEGEFVTGSGASSYLYANALQFSGLIDAVSNIADDNIFLFSGIYDETVTPEVTNELYDFYDLLGVQNIKYVNNHVAGHTYPTNSNGVDCKESKPPYIGNCSYNGALESLMALYPNKVINKTTSAGTLKNISQKKYFGVFDVGVFAPLLQDEAYLYIPKACEVKKCDLHVAFHGCKQTIDNIGMAYINETGLIEAADQMELAILFPQATKGLQNPNGCWDWWGYSGQDYATRTGQQVRIISAMIKDLINSQP